MRYVRPAVVVNCSPVAWNDGLLASFISACLSTYLGPLAPMARSGVSSSRIGWSFRANRILTAKRMACFRSVGKDSFVYELPGR
jgi:hypothetical protein